MFPFQMVSDGPFWISPRVRQRANVYMCEREGERKEEILVYGPSSNVDTEKG